MPYQRETLIAKLRENGIKYLAPSDPQATEQIPSQEALVRALLAQSESRLRLALIPLFISRPALAECVPTLISELAESDKLELKTLYMAAVYLQRLWKTRLGFYFEQNLLLPDLFSKQMGLPPADERFGKNGLYELAEAWQARSPHPFKRLTSLNNTLDLFFEQLKLEIHPPL